MLSIKPLKKSFKQTIDWFKINIPIILWILLLVALIKNYVSMSFLTNIKSDFLAWIVANIFGSLFAWNPINSYIIAGEFWVLSDTMIVVWAFLISWVTVGFVQIPAESYYFGKKYAFLRNILAFVFSLLWAYAIFLLYNIF